MSKYSVKAILCGILSLTTISLMPTSNSYAMDVQQGNISLDQFKAEAGVFEKMRENQQSALVDAWSKYGNINPDNRVRFFLDLNKLAEKWKDRGGILRNGKILGQQAKDIKKYINTKLQVAGTTNDQVQFMDVYGMPEAEFKDTYGSIANEFGAKMQILKSKEEIVNWATTQQKFKVNDEERFLTHIEASHIYDALINGDFI